MELKIKNYQRIRQAELSFPEGLTVIVGSSNNGKSAILRAIDTAIFNIPRDSHITIGEIISAVAIKINDNEIIWQRNLNATNKVAYKIGDKVLQKVGRTQVPEVADLLGIKEIEINGVKSKLNFQGQMSYPFLLDKTPSQVFAFMSQSAEGDNLTVILKRMKGDLDESKKQVKTLETQMDTIKNMAADIKVKRDNLTDRYKLVDEILSVDTIANNQKALEAYINNIEYIVNKKRELEDRDILVAGEYQILENTLSHIDFDSFKKLEGLLNTVEDLHTKQFLCTQTLQDINGKMFTLNKLDSIDFASAKQLKNYLLNIVNIQRERKAIDDKCIVLDTKIKAGSTLEALDFTFVNNLCAKINNIEKLNRDKELYTGNIDSIGIELMNIEKEIQAFGVCPFCGSHLA